MFHEESVKKWKIIKYKQIKREGRVEEPVSLVLDERRKFLGVYFCGEQLEQVFYNMEVSKFPLLRFSDHYLYILFNGQGQGFRLTFLPDQKTEFMGIMRRLAYITESPAKRRLMNDSARFEVWPTSKPSENRNLNSSWSQPSMPPPKKTAARNLNATYSGLPSSSSPSNRPGSSSSSVSSRYSSCSSPFSISFPESSASSVCSGRSSAALSISPHPFTPPPPIPPVVTVNKCVQTERNLLEGLAKDTDFAMGCLRKLMEQEKFGDLVKMMREEIRKMPEEELHEFRLKTDPMPDPKPEPRPKYIAKVVLKMPESSPSTSKPKPKPNLRPKPIIRRETSDMEYDIFGDHE